MKAFVICLASTFPSRGRPSIKLLRKNLPVSVERFNAITPQDFKHNIADILHPIALSTIQKHRSRRVQSELSNTKQAACALSHIRLWEKCANLGEPVMIFEDDVDFNAINAAQFVLRHPYPTDADYVVLSNSKIRGRRKTSQTQHYFATTSFLGTCGYLLTPKGAKQLLRHAFPLFMQVDRYISECILTGLKVYHPTKVDCSLWKGMQHSTLCHDGPFSVLLTKFQTLTITFGVTSLALLIALTILILKRKS